MVRCNLWLAKVASEKVKLPDPYNPGRTIEVVRAVVKNQKSKLVRTGGFNERFVKMCEDYPDGLDAYIVDKSNNKGETKWYERIKEETPKKKKGGRPKKEDETKIDDDAV